MKPDPGGERETRRTAIAGAVVGLMLAAALLGPALLIGAVPARGDLPDFFWPMKAYTAERWAAHQLPLWNPLNGGGEPWLAQHQSGALYPGDVPFLLGWKAGAPVAIGLHLALAAAGMAFWLWELGASRWGALLGAGIYAGGGPLLSLVPVYNNACSASWLPWLFATARRIVVGRSRGAGFALAVAGAFLAGEPAVAVVGSLAALVAAVWAGAEGEAPEAAGPKGRMAVHAAVALLAGVSLAGAALLPFAEYVRNSDRRARTTREEAVARAVGASDLADLVAAPRPEATRVVSPGRGSYLVTLAVGPLPLLLAAGAGAGLPGRRRLLAALGLLAVLGAWLAFGKPGGLAPLLFDLGLLRGLRFPARWFVFTHLALALMAGAGLDGWLWGRFRGDRHPAALDPEEHETREERSRRNAALASLGLGLTLLLLLAALAWSDPLARLSRDPNRTLLATVAAATAVGAIAIARRSPTSSRRPVAVFVSLLSVAPLPYLAGEALAAVPAEALEALPRVLSRPQTAREGGRVFAPAGQDRELSLRWKHAQDEEWGPGPVRRAALALAGYTNLYHGLSSASTASPIGDPRAERLVGAALAGGDLGRILALLNVRQVLSPFPANARGLRAAGRDEGLRLYEIDQRFGRAFFPVEARIATDAEAFESLKTPTFDLERTALVAPLREGIRLPARRPPGSWAAARFLADEPERAELSTTASVPALLVLTRTWDSGWKARIDGVAAPVLRADLALQSVVVPAGEHRIELVYAPASFRWGLGFSAAGLLAVLALTLSSTPGGRVR